MLKNTSRNFSVVLITLSLALIIFASVFYYRSLQPVHKSVLNEQEGTYLHAARTIKQFHVNTKQLTSFSAQNLLNHWTILFFGFTHCGSICPTTLQKLAQTYNALHPTHTNLQILFISLDPERDSLEMVNNYTARFHSDIIGAQGKLSEIRKLQSQFGVYAENNAATTNIGDSIIHTSALFILNPNAAWIAKVNGNLSSDELIDVMQKIIRSSTL